MKSLTLIPLLAAALATLNGCGASGSSGSDNSCDFTSKASYCQDYAAAQHETAAICTAAGGIFAASACSTANRVGSCSNSIATVRYYSIGGTPWTVSTAQTNCTGTGTTFTDN